MSRVWRENGLSIVVFGLFLVFLVAQSVAGHRVKVQDARDHGDPEPSYGEYLTSGGFVEATFENWESEFLQMAAYVVFTIGLRQKGSAESKKLEGRQKVDADPRLVKDKENAPWPVRRGGFVLTLYEHSLGIAFGLLFLLAFGRPCAGRRGRFQPGAALARRTPCVDARVPGHIPVLVRVVPELAERVPGGRVDRRPQHLPAAARLAGVEARGGAALGDGRLIHDGVSESAARMMPAGVLEGEQGWQRLLFLHWPLPPDALRGVVPRQLPLDLRDGSAWVSVIAFDIRSARPPLVPARLGLDFLETNVRTYVRRAGGEPAIWFFSLEASSALAVVAARVAYGLPYWFARMARGTENGAEVYRTVRRQGPGAPGLDVRYRVGASRGTAEPGSLEEFLIERYLLHVVRRGAVRTVRVRHVPYPLREVEVESVSEDLLAAGGVERPDVAPLAHFSEGVDVDVLRVVGG